MFLLLALLYEPSGYVLQATLKATIEESQSRVVIRYELLPAEGATVVPFSVLELEGVRIENLRAIQGETPVSIVDGRIDVVDAEVPFEVELHYRVVFARGAETKRIPVVAAKWMPDDSGAKTFIAEVEIPDGMTLVESFPSGASEVEASRYELALPVLPAFVSLRLARGDPWFTYPRVLDGGVVGVLTGLGIAGLLRLRRRRP